MPIDPLVQSVLLTQVFSAIRSRVPLPSTSAMARKSRSSPPDLYVTAGWKDPSPLPKNTLITPFEQSELLRQALAATKSGNPSLFTSATATKNGLFPPELYVTTGAKMPLALPSITPIRPVEQSLLLRHPSTKTTSTMPSRFKSSNTTEDASHPPEPYVVAVPKICATLGTACTSSSPRIETYRHFLITASRPGRGSLFF